VSKDCQPLPVRTVAGDPEQTYYPTMLLTGCATAAHAPYEAKRCAVARRENIMMNPSPPVVEIHGDDVTVDAGYLAVRLGLSVARLRAEMRRGIIYSVVERGMDEDAGRLRLTFRYRARAWTMVVQRDGDPERCAVVAGATGSPSEGAQNGKGRLRPL
jgi:hypothetical protein